MWGNTNQCTIQPLILLQKRNFLEDMHIHFIQSKLFKFEDIINIITAILLYKAFRKVLPINIQQMFKINKNPHCLTGYGKYALPKNRTIGKVFCLSVCGVKLWNNLDIQQKQCQRIDRFKRLFKN